MTRSVAGFRVGDRVRCERAAPPAGTWERYSGNVGRVVHLDPAAGEIGVAVARSQCAWFRADELAHASPDDEDPEVPERDPVGDLLATIRADVRRRGHQLDDDDLLAALRRDVEARHAR